MSRRPCLAAWLLLLPVVGLGCGDPKPLPCEELAGASELSRVPLVLGEVEVSAEIASTEDERASAWANRRCDLDAMVWVPDEVGPASVTLCEVQVAVDLAFLRNGQVVALERERAPCESPCEGCPVYGEGVVVDAVLWAVTDTLELSVGDPVDGLDGVVLPVESSSASSSGASNDSSG